MAHGYRNLQQWDQWLDQQFLGSCLLENESHVLASLLNRHYGKQALLIGSPHQSLLLKSTPLPCCSILSPLMTKEKPTDYGYIEGDFHELPILTGSIDLVLLPHTLELIDNPRQLLAEACRVIKPEGLIAVCGFNPLSVWGMKKKLTKLKRAPWIGNYISVHQIKNWLRLAEFELEQQKTILFRPPVGHNAIYKKLHFLEALGTRFFPMLGGVYVLVARAKVIPLTPIRLKWKQQLGGIRISTSISGTIAR